MGRPRSLCPEQIELVFELSDVQNEPVLFTEASDTKTEMVRRSGLKELQVDRDLFRQVRHVLERILSPKRSAAEHGEHNMFVGSNRNLLPEPEERWISYMV